MSIKTLSYTKAPTAGTVEAQVEVLRVEAITSIPCPACAGTGYLPAEQWAADGVESSYQDPCDVCDAWLCEQVAEDGAWVAYQSRCEADEFEAAQGLRVLSLDALLVLRLRHHLAQEVAA